MRQRALDLPPRRPAFGHADFLLSQCNRAAFELLERWPDWPAHAVVLHGPPGSGKTHLAHLWRERAGATLVSGADLAGIGPDRLARRPAVAIEDAEGAAERDLLHLYNCCADTGASLLFVARQAPALWPIGLPDLASRLRAAPSVAIMPPDDALLAAVLLKHFADLQVHVAPAVIAYLVPRIERSFAAAAAAAARLDRAALDVGRPITIALARETLDGPAEELPLTWRSAPTDPAG